MSERGVEAVAAALAGRYRVERELGAGGMATVYLAHDFKHDRDVAIKVLHPDLGAALGGERFLAEIRTTARLQHPHILPLLDSGEADGLLYYVMPLVTGETLRARLEREKQLGLADALLIAREVADALQYAHGLGVIHRDIKPENILLQNGHAVVADFGIALAVQSAGGQRMTQTGLSLGTPQYMSPEQAMGERSIDARSDIYALGAVTYEMLTGEAPFTGATVQAVVAKVLSAEPERPTLLRKTIPPGVEAAVLTALAKLPADRFASAAAFAAALERRDGILDGVGSESAATLASRRSPGRLAWAFAALAILGWGAAAALVLRSARVGSGEEALRVSIALPDTAPMAWSASPLAISRDGRTIVYDARLPDGRHVLHRLALDDFAVHPIPGTDAPEDEYRAFVVAPDGQAVVTIGGCAPACTVRRLNVDGTGGLTLATNIGAPSKGSWSVDSLIVVAVRDWSEIAVIPARGGTVRVIAPPNFNVDAPELLPDGQHAVATLVPVWQGAKARWHGMGHFIGVVSLVDGATYAVTSRGLVRSDSAEASDWIVGNTPRLVGGERLLFRRNDGAMMTVGFDARRLRLTSEPVTVAVGVAAGRWGAPVLDASRDGVLAYAPGPDRGTTRLVGAMPGGAVDTLAVAPPAYYIAWDASSDGRYLATISQPPTGAAELRVHDQRTGVTARAEAEAQWDVRFSRDGEWIFYGTPRGQLMRQRASRLSDRDSMAFGGTVLDVSPDGHTVAVTRFTSVARHGVWLVPWGHPESAVLVDSSATAGCGRMSPDGRAMLISAMSEGTYSSFLVPLANRRAARKVSDVDICGQWDAQGIASAEYRIPTRLAAGEWVLGARQPVGGYPSSVDLFGFDYPVYLGARRIQMVGSSTAPMRRINVARGGVFLPQGHLSPMGGAPK